MACMRRAPPTPVWPRRATPGYRLPSSPLLPPSPAMSLDKVLAARRRQSPLGCWLGTAVAWSCGGGAIQWISGARTGLDGGGVAGQRRPRDPIGGHLLQGVRRWFGPILGSDEPGRAAVMCYLLHCGLPCGGSWCSSMARGYLGLPARLGGGGLLLRRSWSTN
jgi:hypothetical protein